MNRLFVASALAASVLWLNTPARSATLPALPAPSSSFNAGSMHVDVYGTLGKPALIFIPGLACGPWEWSGEIARFAPDYQIYALSLPGFDGAAAVQVDPFQTVSNDFWTLLQAHHIVTPAIVGHSLGGTLAILLAEQHSDRLAAVVAVDGMPIFPGMERTPQAQRTAFAQRMSAILGSINNASDFEASEKAYSLPYMVTSKTDIDTIARLTARSDPKATARWMQSDLLLDLRPELTRVTVPFLEVAPFDAQLDGAGAAKMANAQAKQAYYASLLSGAPTVKVQVIEPSRHFIMYDQPDRLHAALSSFLQSL